MALILGRLQFTGGGSLEPNDQVIDGGAEEGVIARTQARACLLSSITLLQYYDTVILALILTGLP